jgi:hypothetical protein
VGRPQGAIGVRAGADAQPMGATPAPLRGNGWKIEGRKAIPMRGGCGAPFPRGGLGAMTKIMREIKALRYIRWLEIGPGTNDPG